jgi:hypothetical protein
MAMDLSKSMNIQHFWMMFLWKNPIHKRISHYPLVNMQKTIENGPVEIVDLPSYKTGGFSSSLCESLPEGISY